MRQPYGILHGGVPVGVCTPACDRGFDCAEAEPAESLLPRPSTGACSG
jgi:hypothetical protein